MDMNKAFSLKTNDRAPKWRVYDASGRTLGRLATEIAVALRGKDKTIYTPHIDAGDYVVVLNCDKVFLTGKKLENKIYWRHSAWLNGRRETVASEMLEKKPEHLIKHAVKGMLPKGPQGRQMLTKLKIYVGSEHPHQAQIAKN
jgi:large subunit ribosomal protein L13